MNNTAAPRLHGKRKGAVYHIQTVAAVLITLFMLFPFIG